MFEREDWTLFRSLSTLGQKAGVAVGLIPKLVAKELADNALDSAGACRITLLADRNGFQVADDGDGIPGDDEAVAALFSVRRPLTSSKLLRKPSRGALGNGLRVVVGAVLATSGALTVATRGRVLKLTPDHATGHTTAERIGGHAAAGTTVEVVLGSGLSFHDDDLAWARSAERLQTDDHYQGKTSPWWYDSESFLELLQAAGSRTVRELIGEFDGCAGSKAGRIAADFKGRFARDLSASEADTLLGLARELARPVNPARLGKVGPWVEGFPISYQSVRGVLTQRPTRGVHAAQLPCVVEVWAQAVEGEPKIEAFVNRTPITAELDLRHVGKGQEKGLALFGCNVTHRLVRRSSKSFRVFLNVITPYQPITSDGKAPDFRPFIDLFGEVTTKTIRKARGLASVAREQRPESTKDVVLKSLPAAIAKAGGSGRYRFSIRQLFYAVRPFVIDSLGVEPEYNYFCQVITEHEADHGDVPGMYRDPRGTLYHPHTGEEIPLGTLSVERYERPAWTFNKILYCEKEGFFPILRDAKWPERYDCALMSAKGFASRAARDVIDLLGETTEGITFYCIHDADAYGTMIYQALQDATKARPGRAVRIVNLGLEPAEAVALDLQVEKVSRKSDRTAPVADYVAPEWSDWLQSNRVELNAMTTPQFLQWLDRKFADQGGKVVPPRDVLADQLRADTLAELTRRITTEVLTEARVDERAAGLLALREPEIRKALATIDHDLRAVLGTNPEQRWTVPVEALARRLARKRRSAVGSALR